MTITDEEWATRLQDRAASLAPPVPVDVPAAVARGRRRRAARRAALSGASLVAIGAVALAVGPVARWATPVGAPTAARPGVDALRPDQRAFADAEATLVTGAAADTAAQACGQYFAPVQAFEVPEMADPRPVFVEERGGTRLTVVEAGDHAGACIQREPEGAGALSDPVPSTVATGDVAVLLYSGSSPSGLATVVAVGRYGSDVRSVEVRQPGADPVAATLVDGYFIAWWAGDSYPDLEVVAQERDGSTTTVLRPGRRTTGD